MSLRSSLNRYWYKEFNPNFYRPKKETYINLNQAPIEKRKKKLDHYFELLWNVDINNNLVLV